MASIRDVMTAHVETAQLNTTIKDAARRMRELRVGSLLVEHEGRMVGIITETDMVRKAIALGLDFERETISAIMTSPLVTIAADKTPQEAHEIMADLAIRHLPVTENGKFIGVTSVRDLLVYYRAVNYGGLEAAKAAV